MQAIPLLFCHGWPGSFAEAIHILEPLCEPSDASPAFHLVVPSMPGYTYSSAPTTTNWQMHDTARVYDALMHRLGAPRLPIADGMLTASRLLPLRYARR
jgi:pimeloyl-ACP methyl ester carboxylesterase